MVDASKITYVNAKMDGQVTLVMNKYRIANKIAKMVENALMENVNALKTLMVMIALSANKTFKAQTVPNV